MPKDLAALLVEEGVVSAEVMAQALSRQAEEGGALDTALLELGAVAEDTLAVALAGAADVPPAPLEAFSAPDARARRVFPSRVADRHGLAPFALDARRLSVVSVFPVDSSLVDEIGFMLSLSLSAFVAPEWRVRLLVHRLYGTPLAPRFAALASAAGELVPAPEEPAARGEEAPARPEAPAPASGFGGEDEGPLEPLAAALAQALEEVDLALPADEPAPGGEGASGAAPPEALEEPRTSPPDRSAPPGWTLEAARATLAAARTRDEVVLAALRYARDFFPFAAMFAVTRDAVAGHDALGLEPEARELARGVAIYADDPGIFRTVIETRSPYLGPVSAEPSGNAAILSGLDRGTPRTVLVAPVLLRDRPVCVLYADNGDAPVSARRLGELLLLTSMIGGAFERIIRERKRRQAVPARREPAPAAAPPPAEPPPPAPAPFDPWSAEGPLRAAPGPAPVSPPADAWTATEPARATPVAAAPAASLPDALEGLEVEIDEAVVAQSTPPAALADRALDADLALAAGACAALAARRREPTIREASERLRRALLSGIEARSLRAARALGALRDVDAIPLLVQVLETSTPGPAQAAADALAAITLQRLGTDARRWLGWWKENRGRGRAEWLFSALTSADRETREAAARELSSAAAPPVAYSADLPSAELEQAARAWAGWWARSGHVL